MSPSIYTYILYFGGFEFGLFMNDEEKTKKKAKEKCRVSVRECLRGTGVEG